MQTTAAQQGTEIGVIAQNVVNQTGTQSTLDVKKSRNQTSGPQASILAGGTAQIAGVGANPVDSAQPQVAAAIVSDGIQQVIGNAALIVYKAPACNQCLHRLYLPIFRRILVTLLSNPCRWPLSPTRTLEGTRASLLPSTPPCHRHRRRTVRKVKHGNLKLSNQWIHIGSASHSIFCPSGRCHSRHRPCNTACG